MKFFGRFSLYCAFILDNVVLLFCGFYLLLLWACLGFFSDLCTICLCLASYICISFLLYKNSTYIILLSKVWERAEEFLPERFNLEEPVPNEMNTDFR